MCQVSSFSLARFQRYRGPKFFPFSNMAATHMTYDVIIIIKTFCMSSRTNVENLFSIPQVVAEKNTKVMCGQTNKQTDRQKNKQPVDPNAIPSPNPSSSISESCKGKKNTKKTENPLRGSTYCAAGFHRATHSMTGLGQSLGNTHSLMMGGKAWGNLP